MTLPSPRGSAPADRVAADQTQHPAAVAAETEEPGSAAVDAALVARVRAGDSSAFSALVERHMRGAFSVAYHVLQHREDAEDAVQQAFVTALTRLDLYDAKRPFAPWFARVVLNHARTARRARLRTSHRWVDHLDRVETSPLASPHRAAEGAEIRERVRAAIELLPDRQQMVVKLIDIEGYSPGEVAAILELSPVTVRWHLMAARHKLRRLLAPHAPAPTPTNRRAPEPTHGHERGTTDV